MAWILGLFAALGLAHIICARRARGVQQKMMAPGDTWDPEDLDAWLALIETFELGQDRPSPKA
ncbi:MAG: hypothetical protein ACYTGN_10330 [Planctomycetota bacterium]